MAKARKKRLTSKRKVSSSKRRKKTRTSKRAKVSSTASKGRLSSSPARSSCSSISYSGSQNQRRARKRVNSSTKKFKPGSEFSACQPGHSSSTNVRVEEIGEPIVKSPLDTHGYRMVQLTENKLKGLLISTCVHPLEPSISKNNKSVGLDKETCVFKKLTEFNETHLKFETKIGSPKSNNNFSKFSKATEEQKQKHARKQKEKQAKRKNKSENIKCTLGIHEIDDEMQSFCNTKCIVVLYIKAGFFQDPLKVPGMAHFCEHAISLGSKNFPEVEAFSKFVETQGGISNARTEQECTVYYFYVNYEVIEKALEMFVDMFAHPIFASGDKIQKEIDNINSEFELKRLLDELRHLALMQSCVADDHPVKSFGMGSRETLNSKDIKEHLIDWISKYYCSENMFFSIQGPLDIKELERLFGTFCSKIPAVCAKLYENIPPLSGPSQRKRSNRQGACSEPNEPPNTPFIMKKWNRLYHVDIMGNTPFMAVTYNIDAKFGMDFKTKPVHYISYILCRKGRGSLTWYLTEKGWIVSLQVNSPESSFCCTSFYTIVSIQMELTSLGLKERMSILKVVFQYINLIQEHGASAELFDELRQLQSDIFHYRSDMNLNDPTFGRQFDDGVVSNSIYSMLHTFAKTESSADLLLNTFLLQEYNPAMLNELANALTPDRAMVVFASKEFAKDANESERWYQTRYYTRPICAEFLSEVRKSRRPNELCFPKKNHFLDVSFCFPDTDMGQDKMERKSNLLIYQNRKGVVFYGNEKCQKGFLPSSQYVIELKSPVLEDYEDMYNLPSIELLMLAIKNVLDNQLALALSSLISCDVEGGPGFIDITLSGPSSKLPLLGTIILRSIQILDDLIKPEMVDNIRKNLIALYHYNLDDSEACVENLQQYILNSRSDFLSDCLHVLEYSYDVDDFLDFVKEFKSRLLISGFLNGCVTKTHASEFAQYLDEYMNFTPYKRKIENEPLNRQIFLPKGERCLLVFPTNKENRNVVVSNYYQLGQVRDRMQKHMLNAISAYLAETAFEELRTKRSLGYIADSSLFEMAGVKGINVHVVGAADNYTSGYINEQIDEFLTVSYEKCLSSKAVFKSELLPLVKEGIDLKLSDVQNFYKTYLFPDAPQFRKLSVQVQGFKKMAKSQPAQPTLVLKKMRMFSSGVKLERCGDGDGDEGSCGVSRYSQHLKIYLDDVQEENGYFITDIQKFKNCRPCYPNMEHLFEDDDYEDGSE